MAKSKNVPEESTTDAYEVGYRKPPEHTRFKPGHSGNPKGRPKGTKNLKSDLLEELSEKVSIRDATGSVRVSKQRAFVKSIVSRAIKGDARAASNLMNTMMRVLDTGEGAYDAEEELTSDEMEILRAFGTWVGEETDTPSGDGGGNK